jgi:iron complex transport system substrate-binding protein
MAAVWMTFARAASRISSTVLIMVALCTFAVPLQAAICVTDDAQRQVCLDRPAQRVIALSPGATELLFSAGAGANTVAAVAHSDFPEAAQKLPRVGSYKRIDLEAVLALKPDLIVAWRSGNPLPQTEQLEKLGFAVYYAEPLRFEGVSTTIERFSRLTGTETIGVNVAQKLRRDIAALRHQYAQAASVPVFYQVWREPLMTINNDHLISEAIGVCAGVNVFGELPSLAPRISEEAVLAEDPEVIVAGGMGEDDPSWLEPWKQFSALQAVQRNNLFFVAPSTLQRPTPRMVEGIRTLCAHLEIARGRR